MTAHLDHYRSLIVACVLAVIRANVGLRFLGRSEL